MVGELLSNSYCRKIRRMSMCQTSWDSLRFTLRPPPDMLKLSRHCSLRRRQLLFRRDLYQVLYNLLSGEVIVRLYGSWKSTTLFPEPSLAQFTLLQVPSTSKCSWQLTKLRKSSAHGHL